MQPPAQAVRNHERVEPPLRKFLEKLGWRCRVLSTIDGELPRIDSHLAIRNASQPVEQPEEVRVSTEPERTENLQPTLQPPQQPSRRGAIE